MRSQADVALFEAFVSYVREDSVDLISVTETISLMTSFGLQNGSEFLGMFNYHIAKVKSSGVLAKLTQTWLRCEVS